jgi:hypothetical protein
MVKQCRCKSSSEIWFVLRNSLVVRTLCREHPLTQTMEADMGFGRGVLFWLLGVPIPIIILLALFWHH